MDFLKWLNALGSVLYEVMSWLIFYPITLWRTITRPLETMRYADAELNDREDEQFADTLNPPLFLVLSLLLSQAIGEAVNEGVNPIVAKQTGLAQWIDDDMKLLVLRLILFSLFPLMMAVRFVRARGDALTRRRLKAPFYAQCYACAPFALFLGLGATIGHIAGPDTPTIGVILSIAAMAGYFGIETLWFSHHLRIGRFAALTHAARAFVQAAALAIALALLVVLR